MFFTSLSKSNTLSPLHDPSTAGEAAAEPPYTAEPHLNQSPQRHPSPLSDDGMPETDQASLNVSTRFNFNFDLDPILPDIFVLTADSVFFAVHSHRLRAASIDTFGGILTLLASTYSSRTLPVSLAVPEQSGVINVLLCAAYELSPNISNPSLDCIAEAVQAMKRYGMLPLKRFMSRGTPLYDTILYRAPFLPIEAYALVGAEDLEELAVACSSYTLHLKLYLISDELATKMGAVYLNRLYRLQGTRMSALKNMLGTPIYPHVAKPYCSVEQRQFVNRAYALGAAKVYYDATPGESKLFSVPLIAVCFAGRARLSSDPLTCLLQHCQATPSSRT